MQYLYTIIMIKKAAIVSVQYIMFDDDKRLKNCKITSKLSILWQFPLDHK